jgi:16S rRNA (cytidine1402-2'-O)-methyltransferase
LKLYLVPTPIGNLDDITLRAVKVLQSVDGVLAEDTRNTGLLLSHLGVKKPLYAHHAHNEHPSVPGVVKLLKEGKTLALCSDAGTPGISDPGFLLVRECLRAGVPVECLPGPTAFVPALVNSGLPTDRFAFEGFLPPKKGRLTRLNALKDEPRTMIFYESPHRLLRTLEQFIEVFGMTRPASVSRELTKIFEETIRGTLLEIHSHYAFNQATIRGEIVLVVAGA